MRRFVLAVGCVLAASPLRAEPPAGPGPKLAVAVVKGGAVLIEDPVLVTAVETRTREVVENGVTRQVNEAVSVTRVETRQISHDLKNVKAYDLDGREILPSRLAAMLRERKAVAIAEAGGKLSPLYRAALRDDVPVLVLPPLQP